MDRCECCWAEAKNDFSIVCDRARRVRRQEKRKYLNTVDRGIDFKHM